MHLDEALRVDKGGENIDLRPSRHHLTEHDPQYCIGTLPARKLILCLFVYVLYGFDFNYLCRNTYRYIYKY